MISLKNFTFTYKNGDETKLNRASIQVDAGQFVLVCGATGSGKSTLAKLLTGEIKLRSGRNAVQGQLFSEMLKKTLNAYHNRAIATQEVLEELLNLAREVRTAAERGEKLKMTEEEIAFYDALANNESAVKAMGDDKLKVIAAELVTKVRQSTTIDWTMRESARAAIRVMVKRILRQYGYPPDFQDAAVQTILLQAELLCKDWAA